MNKVTCITKPNRDSRYDAIQKLAGTKEDDGGRWSCTRQECVAYIEKGYKFYVNVSGHKVYLIVGTSANGNKYVRTDPDQDAADNLLSLPECP
ncbi:DUF3892 domain-containing protein [Sulfitobacter sp. W002]|uniref:DUF3892 domain-containing protein n=1 Tax=unclassified Sulfitobacter TaxID=196795 RepID=UPI000E777801|nr:MULTISPECIES: DUF3892 domain-containing protein [unclassified Sulfitobacter]AYE87245.1 hypothetical protein B5M07_14600 [Sulfitobacter sp. D7]UWR29591.1 DUF3892 domain-containing protein [Sulfitobacter sp. W002]